MTVIDFIKKYYPFILLILVIILGVVLFQTLSTLKQERKDREYREEQAQKNFEALGDSIKADFNRKLDAYEFTKDNYVVDKLKDLEKYNKNLTRELEKVKGDVIAAIQTDAESNLGGISTSNDVEVLDNKTNHYGLNFKTEYADAGFSQKLVGTSKFYVIPDETTKKWTIQPDVTVLDTNITNIQITYGFKDYKDKYQVFAISPSDKVKLNDLNGGYFIDKQPLPPPEKTKRFGVGPYVGYGLNTYNTETGSTGVDFGWSVGVSLHYDIFKF